MKDHWFGLGMVLLGASIGGALGFAVFLISTGLKL